MSYIRLSDLAGLGQSPEEFDKTATGLEAQAASFEQQAQAFAGQPQAQVLANQAQAFRASAAQLRQRAAQARAESAQTAKAVTDISTSLLNAGAVIGTSYLQSDQARKAAADARRAAATNQPGFNPAAFGQPPQQSGGMSTGLMVGLAFAGVAVVAGIGIAVAVSRKKGD